MIPCRVGGCTSEAKNIGMCWKHATRLRRYGDVGFTKNVKGIVERRLWFPKSYAIEGDCWVWQARRNHDGYGIFKMDGKLRFAHRFAYELRNGPVPDGLELDHLCRNRACVNPDHLEAVTHQVNIARSPIVGGYRGRRSA